MQFSAAELISQIFESPGLSPVKGLKRFSSHQQRHDTFVSCRCNFLCFTALSSFSGFFSLTVGDTVFVDDETLDKEGLIREMSQCKGFVANTLGFWGIGIASDIGTIEMKGIARGQKKALAAIIDDMQQRCGNVRELILDHCMNEDFARQVESAARERWPEINVTILQTRGLCSYYAERGGLIIGYC